VFFYIKNIMIMKILATKCTVIILFANTSLADLTPTFDTDSYLFIGTNNQGDSQITLGETQRPGTGHFNFGVLEFDVTSLMSSGQKFLDLNAVEYVTLIGGNGGIPTSQVGPTGAATVQLIALGDSFLNYQSAPNKIAWYDTYVQGAGANVVGTYNFSNQGVVSVNVTSVVNSWLTDSSTNMGFALYSSSGNLELASTTYSDPSLAPRVRVEADTVVNPPVVEPPVVVPDVEIPPVQENTSDGVVAINDQGTIALSEARSGLVDLLVNSNNELTNQELSLRGGIEGRSEATASLLVDALSEDEVENVLNAVKCVVENTMISGLQAQTQSKIAHLNFLSSSVSQYRPLSGSGLAGDTSVASPSLLSDWQIRTGVNYLYHDALEVEQFGGELALLNNFGLENYTFGIGLSHSSMSRDLLNGESDLSGNTFSLASSYLLPESRVRLTGVLSHSLWDNDMQVGKTVADSSGSSTAIFLSAEVQDAFSWKKLDFTPRVSYTWVDSEQEGYRFGVLNLDELSNQVNIWRIGIDARYKITSKAKIVGVLELAQRTSDDYESKTVSLGDEQGYTELEDTWVRLGLRGSYALTHSTSANASVFTSTEGSDSSFQVNLGLQHQF
jgi:hypothetical protein